MSSGGYIGLYWVENGSLGREEGSNSSATLVALLLPRQFPFPGKGCRSLLPEHPQAGVQVSSGAAAVNDPVVIQSKPTSIELDPIQQPIYRQYRHS